MVEAVRAGKSMRSVARRFNVTLPTVQRRVKRAQGLDLDAVDWTTHVSVLGRVTAQAAINLLTMSIANSRQHFSLTILAEVRHCRSPH
jgi:hypothetical protein